MTVHDTTSGITLSPLEQRVRAIRWLMLLPVLGVVFASGVSAEPIGRYNVVWDSPDSCPDFDHFGSGSTALQRMLVQEAGDKILLLPAWPADWDADFKLHLAGKTTIRGKVVGSELADWSIEPEAHRKDVMVHRPQPVPVRPAVPDNNHPLRIGADQSGGNRFQGKIGRATVFRGLLKPERVRALVAGDRNEELADEAVIDCLLEPKAGDTLSTRPGDLAGTLSFETWIHPDKSEAGRIFDKLTAGKRDGFLIDCWPGQSLRVIVGPRQEDFADVLQPGVWQHVTVILGKGWFEVYLDGDKL